MEVRIYLFIILMFIIFGLGLLLFHAYSIMPDKTHESGAAEILSSSVICFRSSSITIFTLLTLFVFTSVNPIIGRFVLNLLFWQTFLSIFFVLILLAIGTYRMEKNTPETFREAKKSIILGFMICGVTLAYFIGYHFIYSKQKDVEEIK